MSGSRKIVCRSRVANFNPRSPYGERQRDVSVFGPLRNFNPRSPYGERPLTISQIPRHNHISIRAPHTGSDVAHTHPVRVVCRFQSALPIRGATQLGQEADHVAQISIRAPHTGSDGLGRASRDASRISIRAPHTGSDAAGRPVVAHRVISIRAPHTGSDDRPIGSTACRSHFNPRSPYGERRDDYDPYLVTSRFQSALPIRGATKLSSMV